MSKTILILTALTILSTFTYIKLSSNTLSKFDQMVLAINNNPNSTWKAQIYHGLSQQPKKFNLTIEDTLPDNFDPTPNYDHLQVNDLPESFDAREQWPQCDSIKEIWDQSACGSCWAIGAASSMSDRLCIKNQSDQRRISAEDLLECCSTCGFGCDGGLLYNSWSHWKKVGIVTGEVYGNTTSCKPYLLPPCNHHGNKGPYDDCSNHDYAAPLCEEKCSNENYQKSYTDDRVKASKAYQVAFHNTMLKELVQNGPFEASMRVYEDFLLYKEGIYQHQQGEFLGMHAVRILGYGVEDGVKFWTVANSWNDTWGDKGTFKILRGRSHCGIETDGAAGLPQ